MNIDVNCLADDPALLKKLLAEHAEKLAQATARNRYLEQQFRLAQQKQFGKSAEVFDAQSELFNEAEDIIEQPDSLLHKRLATLAKHQSANHYPKTYPVSK